MPYLKKKIHIMHLTTDSAVGGTEKMIVEIASSLPKDIFRSTVAALKPGGYLEQLCFKNNIEFVSLNMKSKLDFTVVFRLFNLIRKNNVDILHTYLFHANILGRAVGRIAKVPLIFSGQRNVDLWRNFFHNAADRLTVKFCEKIISNSSAGKEFLVKNVGIEQDKILVVPNGINVENYNQVKHKAKKTINFSVVASLTRKKGHSYLFKSFQKMYANNKNVKLMIIGTGPLKNELEQLSVDLGINENTVFLGFLDNPAKYLEQSDIFVLPSLWEGMPVALMEAMACGLPCIASDVGGVGELIDNNISGILVKPKDIDALYESMLRLISSPDERAKLGEGARKKISNCYSKKNMINQLEQIYLGKRRR
ncbi:glycosyltransferase [bacterium]|nr:glycosyltransferase [bacterium]